jgi:hypothetical protein
MSRSTRLAAVYVALTAMFLRALIPMGWMPSASSGAPLTICTMQGPMLADTHGQQPQQHDGTHHSEACPFAAAPQFSSPAVAANIAPPSHVIAFASASLISTAPATSAQHTPQSPRAPPNLA